MRERPTSARPRHRTDRLLEKARSAKRESKDIEFKEKFDIASVRDWVEILKDIVAMANSGGGAILFGVKNNGTASTFDTSRLLSLDPAQVTDKIAKYTGEQFSGFSINEISRGGHMIAVLLVSGSLVPLAFSREGSYQSDEGQEKFAFRKGTVYFRHGAKSEPATTNDLREWIDRELARVRDVWLSGIRKVVEAPKDAILEVLSPAEVGRATKVHLTNDKGGLSVTTLNPDLTHPYRLKETIAAINKGLPGGKKVNSYDIQCVRKAYEVDSKPEYLHRPKFGSPQYSDAFVTWVLKQFTTDPGFFASCRDKMQERSFSPKS